MQKFIPNKLSDSITIENIYTIHYFKYMKDFRFTGESHNFWELVYIDAGEAEISANEESFTLTQGEAVFHAPNEFHNIATYNHFANSVIISFECEQSAMDFFVGRRVTLTDEEKLLELNKKLEQLENQKKAIQARVSEKERKARTKRLIETGAEVEAALGFSLDTPEARKALGDFLRNQEARGKWVSKAIQEATSAAAEVAATE